MRSLPFPTIHIASEHHLKGMQVDVGFRKLNPTNARETIARRKVVARCEQAYESLDLSILALGPFGPLVYARLPAELEDEKVWKAQFESTTDDQWDRIAEMVRQEIAAGDIPFLAEVFPSQPEL